MSDLTEPSELRGDEISRKAAIEALIELAAPADVPHALEDIYDKGVADSIGVLESLPSVPEPSSAPTGLTRLYEAFSKEFDDAWVNIRLNEDEQGNVTEGDEDAHSWWQGMAAGVEACRAILESSSAPTHETE